MQTHVAWCVQEGLYKTAQRVVKEALRKLGNEPTMHLWDAMARLLEGRGDATRDLESLLTHHADLSLPIRVALLTYHKRAKDQDAATVNTLRRDRKPGH